MKHASFFCSTILVSVSIALSATAGNWPGWRGPEGTGISSENHLPAKWSTNQNVRWRHQERGIVVSAVFTPGGDIITGHADGSASDARGGGHGSIRKLAPESGADSDEASQRMIRATSGG